MIEIILMKNTARDYKSLLMLLMLLTGLKWYHLASQSFWQSPLWRCFTSADVVCQRMNQGGLNCISLHAEQIINGWTVSFDGVCRQAPGGRRLHAAGAGRMQRGGLLRQLRLRRTSSVQLQRASISRSSASAAHWWHCRQARRHVCTVLLYFRVFS